MKKLLTITSILLIAVLCLTSCGKKDADGKTITVGATPSPHAEILEICKGVLAEQGIELNIVEFNDYVQPNLSTQDGALDANFFQHTPYLDSFNEDYGTTLVSVASVHFEPLGVYCGKVSSFEQLTKGSIIAVPNDKSNEARALLLLEACGLIKIDPNAGINATVLDITENPLGLEFAEIEAAQLTAHLKDVDLAVINGNYAIGAGLSVAKDAIACEDAASTAAATYANILVVKEGREQDELVKALCEALLSDEVRNFIEESYDGSVVAVF